MFVTTLATGMSKSDIVDHDEKKANKKAWDQFDGFAFWFSHFDLWSLKKTFMFSLLYNYILDYISGWRMLWWFQFADLYKLYCIDCDMLSSFAFVFYAEINEKTKE